MNKLFNAKWPQVSTTLAAIFYCTGIAHVNAATLTLPEAPLTTTKSIEHNLMLLIDSSGSMMHIVEDSVSGSATQYDADVDYYDCPSNKDKFSTSKYVTVNIDPSTGAVSMDYQGDNYDFGERCFDDDKQYKARLYANDSDGGDYVPSNYGEGYFSGNYLNWYFSNSDQSGPDIYGAGARKKPAAQTRSEVAQDAATSLVSGLANIRVGLAQYTDKTGAYLLENISDVDVASHKSSLLAHIATIYGADKKYTPLGEAIQGLGYYFTLGNSENLTLHPDSTQEQAKPSEIFLSETLDASSVVLPSEVITDWCQQSFMLVMTDGLPTQDENFSEYLEDYYNSEDNYFSDDTIAAMYEMDLRPDLNESNTVSTKNNVTSYVVGFAAELAENELMQDMAAASETDLLTATNSAELISAFDTITQNILAKVGAGSGASFNTTSLSEDSVVYAASFNSSAWSGSLAAYDLDSSGAVSGTASWTAETKLDALGYSNRNIFSYNNSTKKGVTFDRSSLAGSTLISDLQAGPLGSSDTAVDSLIDYLSGDTSNEGTGSDEYRARDNLLGDIVNSTVAYVGAPELNWPDYTENSKFGSSSESYSDFKSGSASSRTPMLYVGANDGMLHGFNGDSSSNDEGQEEFAYIPAYLASASDNQGLHYLAEQDYAHSFYVDLSPVISDAYIDSEWRTLLVGGSRSGGKGIFALDITDPSKFSATSNNAENLALWEFSASDDIDFGYSFSSPTVAMMANGKWAVIVGNGYNNAGDGTAKLFILFIEQGLDGSWTKTTDYFELETKVGTQQSINGLSTPTAVDIDGDSVVDRIYAGDLEGNLWAFDVTNSDANQWGSAYWKDGNPAPLFIATDDNGNAQPITTAPTLALNENVTTTDANSPNLLVFFGTGKYIEESDKSSTDIMTYYGVLDDNSNGTNYTGKTRSDLTTRKLVTFDSDRAVFGDSFLWSVSDGWYLDLVHYTSSSDSAATFLGERVITNSQVRNDMIIFTTAFPTADNVDVCLSNSESWLMALNINTGLAASYTVFDVNGDGVIDDSDTLILYDTDGDGDVDADDEVYSAGKKISGSMVTGDVAILSGTAYTNDVDGNLNTTEINIKGSDKVGRLSWEELLKP